ncbi:MAG: OmpA family protein [Candidatus Omnitrophica bacterium]|nr:OmpA family protein [Candidatus Omnitrophota bacterium]
MFYFINRVFTLMILIVCGISLSGCNVVFQKGRRVDVEKISTLKNELSDMERELSELEKAKNELESRLSNEIGDKEVKVEMNDRGLVITFVAEVLFDSGKAELRRGSNEKLEKVAQVLNTTVRDLNVGIEGHTDNVPIKVSGWKTNWELSSARALSVLHMMVNELSVEPTRLSATGFGEYRPVESNDSKEGRQKNRRVEIVILPPTTIEGRK